MKLALVHYHLNRGGVTQVILNHLRALSAVHTEPEPLQVAIFFGGQREAWSEDAIETLGGVEVTLEPVPELAYDSQAVAEPEKLAASLIAAFERVGLERAETVVHIHNHALGKNASLPGAVERLSQAGFALLLQIHDFAEDFRPDNYRHLVTALASDAPKQLPARIYPQGSSIHYAVLNGRDHRILAGAGIAASHLHSLPNPVFEIGTLPDRTAARQKLTKLFGVASDRPYVLYPVRGIRRKNLGEMLLWGAACGDSVQFALTLPPLNPVEQPRYNSWKQLTEELSLPVLFEVGAAGGLEFGENLAAADRILTTSVAEGFGMVFLETWLAGQSLVGRDLPEITADFVASGLAFSTLRPAVHVPLDWVQRDVFAEELRAGYLPVLEAYGQPILSDAEYEQGVSQLFEGGLLDFAHCSARLQAFIVTQVAQDPQRQQELRQVNPGFGSPLEQPAESTVPSTQANAQAVRKHYSLESSGMRLQKLYQIVLESPRCEPHDLTNGSSILDAFLSLQRFNPIRTD